MEFIDLVFIKSGDLNYALLYFLIFFAVSFTIFWFALKGKKGSSPDLIFGLIGLTLFTVMLSSYFFYSYAKSPLSDTTIERLISNGHLTSDVFDRLKFDIQRSKNASAENLYSISYIKISNAILYVEKSDNELSSKKDFHKWELKIREKIEKNQGINLWLIAKVSSVSRQLF